MCTFLPPVVSATYVGKRIHSSPPLDAPHLLPHLRLLEMPSFPVTIRGEGSYCSPCLALQRLCDPLHLTLRKGPPPMRSPPSPEISALLPPMPPLTRRSLPTLTSVTVMTTTSTRPMRMPGSTTTLATYQTLTPKMICHATYAATFCLYLRSPERSQRTI